ncbi:MAG: hypothetical protein ACD_41C00349G0003 [uncultured bacterium]|nr:MAG: hypothetical protein ACD_41C00349G0003 [uncultured bacterium]HBY73171.1 hypothetical protein [Candidatus Kerfeldbacteria bacterium]
MRKTILASVLSAGTAGLLLIGAGCTGTTTPTTTTTTTNKNTPAVEGVTFDVTASDAEVEADDNGQWAKTATASSEYGTDSWAAKQATGQPNVDVYGDNISAWAHLEKNKGEETIEVTFAKAVNAVGVRIRETYGSGAVTKVELIDLGGQYYTIWEGTDSTVGLGYLQVPVDITEYLVNGVRVTVDTSLVPNEWAEIDAVQLVGE